MNINYCCVSLFPSLFLSPSLTSDFVHMPAMSKTSDVNRFIECVRENLLPRFPVNHTVPITIIAYYEFYKDHAHNKINKIDSNINVFRPR